jgi:hypothetical protein
MASSYDIAVQKAHYDVKVTRCVQKGSPKHRKAMEAVSCSSIDVDSLLHQKNQPGGWTPKRCFKVCSLPTFSIP